MNLEDAAWGPALPGVPQEGHPLAEGVARGRAEAGQVTFRGGRIDAQLLCEGSVLRTAEATEWRCGLAQARRLLDSGALAVAHVVFAPVSPDSLLLGLVRLHNSGAEPLVVEYTELWDVGVGAYRAVPGGCERDDGSARLALADLSAVIRARAPRQPRGRGLALDLTFAIPGGQTRQLAFGYVAPEPDSDPGLLARAFRGAVAAELERTAALWLQRLDAVADPVAAYRSAARAGNSSG